MRTAVEKSDVTVSHCSRCGILIGASRSVKVLETLEKLHRCPKAADRRSLQSRNGKSVPAKKNSARREINDDKLDRLMIELAKQEPKLRRWIENSPDNARLFASDPVSAICKADLGLDSELVRHLLSITSSIAEKIRRAT